MTHIVHSDSLKFLKSLPSRSVEWVRRRFQGSEGIKEDAVRANLRCQNANLSKAV